MMAMRIRRTPPTAPPAAAPITIVGTVGGVDGVVVEVGVVAAREYMAHTP